MSFSVRQVESRDEECLLRWLNRQTKLHIRFNLDELADWFATHQGFVATHEAEPIGFVLYAGTSSTHVSLIGLAIGDQWHRHEQEILTRLFQKTVLSLRKCGISTVTCVTPTEWLQTALRQYLNFQAVGNLASYLKSDWHIPELGNPSVQIGTASPSDAKGLLNVDRAAFPSLWQLDEHTIFSALRRNGYLLKAELQGIIVGYVSGTWQQEHGHLNRLAVHPQVQGLGMGKRLLAEGISHFHQAGVYQITLNTQADNLTSRRLYERFGFHLVQCDAQVLVRKI